MSVTVMRYAPFWPHERRSFLRDAADVAYGFELMQPGQFSFRLPVTSRQTVQEGDIIGIRSAYGLPDYAGVVEKVKTAEGGAYAEVAGQELASLLVARNTRQQTVYTSGTYGRIAAEIIEHANSRNPTNIIVRRPLRSDAIPTAFTVRSGPALHQVSDLAALTGWEWTAVYRCEEALAASIILANAVGRDMRRSHMITGRMVADAEHDRDIINDAQLVQIVGDVGDFGGRPSAAAIVDAPTTMQDIAQTVVAVSDGHVRRPQRRSIATARETAITRLDFSDSLAVQRKAIETIRQLVGGLEVIQIKVTTAVSWSALAVGNVVTLVLPNAEYGVGITAVYRILGVQPDHDTGLCEVVGKVLPDAA